MFLREQVMPSLPRIVLFLTGAWMTAPLWAQAPREKSPASDQRLEATDFAALLARQKIIDLTYPFEEQTVYWPTENGFKLLRGPAGVTEKGYFYSANRFVAAEHGGTHVDAPIHFFQGRQTVDQIPLERLTGEAVVIDVTEACAANRDYEIGVDDLRRWEEQHGRQLVEVIVLLRTGHGRHWNNRTHYLGTSKTGPDAVADLHFPGLDPAAARWLVEHRAIKSIGIDTPSIDHGQSRRFQSHVTLFEHNVPAFENVAHLDQLPETGAVVIALPMKIGEGSGAPLRIIALVPE
jgi:kynurenine formamidase